LRWSATSAIDQSFSGPLRSVSTREA
jgi:hypothetical protein